VELEGKADARAQPALRRRGQVRVQLGRLRDCPDGPEGDRRPGEPLRRAGLEGAGDVASGQLESLQEVGRDLGAAAGGLPHLDEQLPGFSHLVERRQLPDGHLRSPSCRPAVAWASAAGSAPKASGTDSVTSTSPGRMPLRSISAELGKPPPLRSGGLLPGFDSW